MRSVFLILLSCVSLAAAEPVKPAVVFGTTALLAKNNSAVVFCVLFSPDSGSIGLFDSSGLRYWSLATAKQTASRLENDGGEVSRMFVAGDGRSLILYAEGEKQKLGRVDLAREDTKEIKLDARPDSLFVSECGEFAAIEARETLRIIRTTDGEPVVEFPATNNLRRFSASLNGRAFAWCNRDGHVQLREPGALAWSPPRLEKSAFSSVAISPDGSRLATASFFEDESSGRKTAGPIQLWSVAEKKLILTCDAADWFAEFPNRLRFTPDGKMLLAGDGAFLRGWDTATGKLTFAVEPGWNYPGPIIISPNNRYVAVAFPKRGMVWDLTTGKPPPGFEAHTGPVWEMVFSPDGRQTATTSYGQQQVNLWDAKSGRFAHELNCTFAENKSPVNKPDAIIPGRIKVQFSRDSATIATFNEASGKLGPLRLWNTADAQLVWNAEYRRTMTAEMTFAGNRLFMCPKRFDPLAAAVPDSDGKHIFAVENLFRRMHCNARGDRVACEKLVQTENPIFDENGTIIDQFDGVPLGFTPDQRGLIILRLGPAMTNGTFVDHILVRDLAAKKDGPPRKVPMGQAVGQLSADAEFRVAMKWDGDGSSHVNRAFEFREVAGDRSVSMTYRVDQSDGNEAQLRMMMMAAPHRPAAYAFSPDNRLFAAVYATGKLAVWEVATGEEVLVTDTTCLTPKFLTFSPDSRRVFTASGEGAGGPVFGYDTAEPLATASAGHLGLPVRKARGAVHALATKPVEAVTAAKAILAPATIVDEANYDRWIANLDAAAFDDREAATSALAEAGWRVEAKLKATLASTGSAEVRERLTVLLQRRDRRPLRVIQLLELAGSSDAKAELTKLAAATPETFLSREARRALARMP